MAYFMLAEGRDKDQLAELDDLIYRPLDEEVGIDRHAGELAALDLPFQVVGQ